MEYEVDYEWQLLNAYCFTSVYTTAFIRFLQLKSIIFINMIMQMIKNHRGDNNFNTSVTYEFRTRQTRFFCIYSYIRIKTITWHTRPCTWIAYINCRIKNALNPGSNWIITISIPPFFRWDHAYFLRTDEFCVLSLIPKYAVIAKKVRKDRIATQDSKWKRKMQGTLRFHKHFEHSKQKLISYCIYTYDDILLEMIFNMRNMQFARHCFSDL